MPELAEVELSRRCWAVAEGETILKEQTHPSTRVFRDCEASHFKKHLLGKQMTHSCSHGKRMFFSFGEKLHLELHLGMAGRLFIEAPGYLPQKHDHFVLETENHALVYSDYRQFGRVLLHHDQSPWKDLPLDPRSRAFTQKYLQEKLSSRQKASLKALLLDQALFPGIGNWMADEICWRLGAHPGNRLAQIEFSALCREVKAVVRGALKHVADNNSHHQKGEGFAAGSYVANVPPATWLFQHRWKKGGFCPKCSCELSRGTIASRTTAWCPHCQK